MIVPTVVTVGAGPREPGAEAAARTDGEGFAAALDEATAGPRGTGRSRGRPEPGDTAGDRSSGRPGAAADRPGSGPSEAADDRTSTRPDEAGAGESRGPDPVDHPAEGDAGAGAGAGAAGAASADADLRSLADGAPGAAPQTGAAAAGGMVSPPGEAAAARAAGSPAATSSPAPTRPATGPTATAAPVPVVDTPATGAGSSHQAEPAPGPAAAAAPGETLAGTSGLDLIGSAVPSAPDEPAVRGQAVPALATAAAAPSTPGAVDTAPETLSVRSTVPVAPATAGAEGPSAGTTATEGGEPGRAELAPPRLGAELAGVTPPGRAETAPRAAGVAPAATPPPAPPPLSTQLSSVLGRLQSAGDGRHVLNIHVDPEDLGPIRVQAHISAEGVRIELLGITEASRDALKGALGDLRRELAAGGLHADLDLASEDGARHEGRGERTETSGETPRPTVAPATVTAPTVNSAAARGGLDLLA